MSAPDSTNPRVCYFGTDDPIRPGDRILVRRTFGRSRLATIVYVPGWSEPDRDLGEHEWAYKTDDGAHYVSGYFPKQLPHLKKRIELVSRPGNESADAMRRYQFPPEQPDGQPGRDFLALIGGAVLVTLLVLAAIAAVMWLSA